MRHYVKCWINSRTGDIDHIAVSDAPLNTDPIQPGIPIAIPGEPVPAPLTFAIEELEVLTPGSGMFRAREMLSKLENRNGRIAIRLGNAGMTTAQAKPRRDFKDAPV